MKEKELFKKKITPEEKLYTEAVSLQEAVACVLRFEERVSAYKSAAHKFQKLGEYKDAPKRAEICERKVKEELEAGERQVLAEAMKRMEAAETKSDYAEVIAQLSRIRKTASCKERAKEEVKACKQKIKKIETRAVWKRRGIAFFVIALCAVLFLLSPLYPFAKGYIWQSRGNYRAAAENYTEASALPWADSQLGKCYYRLGKEKEAAGEYEKALAYYKKARKKGNTSAKKAIKKVKEKMEQLGLLDEIMIE